MPGTRALARLYRGNGGATSAFWYSVTFQHHPLGRERQFLFAYHSPAINRIACSREGVHVGGLVSEAGAPSTQTFTLAEIDTVYAPRPMTFSYGVANRVYRGRSAKEQFYRWLALVVGLALGAAGSGIATCCLTNVEAAERSKHPVSRQHSVS